VYGVNDIKLHVIEGLEEWVSYSHIPLGNHVSPSNELQIATPKNSLFRVERKIVVLVLERLKDDEGAVDAIVPRR
jgi:hypothetical protein